MGAFCGLHLFLVKGTSSSSLSVIFVCVDARHYTKCYGQSKDQSCKEEKFCSLMVMSGGGRGRGGKQGEERAGGEGGEGREGREGRGGNGGERGKEGSDGESKQHITLCHLTAGL